MNGTLLTLGLAGGLALAATLRQRGAANAQPLSLSPYRFPRGFIVTAIRCERPTRQDLKDYRDTVEITVRETETLVGRISIQIVDPTEFEDSWCTDLTAIHEDSPYPTWKVTSVVIQNRYRERGLGVPLYLLAAEAAVQVDRGPIVLTRDECVGEGETSPAAVAAWRRLAATPEAQSGGPQALLFTPESLGVDLDGSLNRRGSRAAPPRLVYVPEPDSDMELDEDLDIQTLDAGARALAHRVGIGILRGKDLRVVALDAQNAVVGALFDEIGPGEDSRTGRHRQEYNFDLLVDPAHQRTGLGTRLMKEGLALGRENAQAGIPTVIDAVNPVAQAMFAKAGFVVTGRSGGHATMERKKGSANADPSDIRAFRDLLVATYGLDDTTWLSRPSSGEVIVHTIAVAKANRGEGRAQKAMEHLGRWADANGAIVVLTPANDFGASKVRLTAWYRRLGYTSNTGRRKDYRFRETMIRRPNR